MTKEDVISMLRKWEEYRQLPQVNQDAGDLYSSFAQKHGYDTSIVERIIGRYEKGISRKISEITYQMTEDFAQNPDDDAMIDAAAKRLTGNPRIDADILRNARLIWLLMDAAQMQRKKEDNYPIN